MSFNPNKITFFDFLTPLVASGAKTITIRDNTEKDYPIGQQVEVFTLETDEKVCDIEVLSVVPITHDQINEFHAQQEALELPRLKSLIKEVYPNTDELYVITFKRID
ncbi:N(4)-acetylcytidine aminohydrolase [Vibrio sp. CAU 1672]|uniref:N(4)-acetylcytidine aminohydrolase n=1 Tax=Vibrio sp. CAU 1672 TaxID=3032594 RepID=UPI0023D9F27D|nr:N(4)-acetylcytidine aminohydrolase [Vibrio sp. CAU 1672]MDF2153416.1 N(4)-acetylcytidine aminohydrolase [Vibrio sp. CAU 1672]